nr:copia protein [Tanacetum cinerariifolium]
MKPFMCKLMMNSLEKELKQIEANDQAIQTILLGLPEDIYAAINSCETAQEIWLRVQQMMKGFDIGIQEKKAKLFNEWKKFTSNERESIESYYHCFLNLMNDLKRNKHFPEKIASQDRQMQMVGGNGKNQFRQYAGQNVGNLNRYNAVQNVENQNLNGNGNLVAARAEGNAAGQNGNQIRCYNCRGVGHFARNCTVRPRRRDAAYLQTQLLIAQKEEAGIQLQAEEYDLMADAVDFSLGYPDLLVFMGTVRFRNDHVAAILGFGDLQWGNILITRVYFIEGLGHNLFLVGQFCDLDLEVAFRRNACFVGNLEGVDLLKGDRSTNLYTINLHAMAFTSPICLMARASSTKSWLWHQRLSHLNFDNINDLARNDLVSGLPKFKYHKEHLCPLHLLHMDLCGPMRIASINGKRYVLVIMDDYSRYTWVHFLRSKDEAPENDREDIWKLGAIGDIGFFIGSGLDLTYAPSTITTQQPTEGELDLLFEAMYDDYIGGQPSATTRTVPPTQEPQAKYVLEILKKYGMKSCDLVGTPMEIKDKLDLDQTGTLVDATKYRSMIGALMYLTSSRPDIVHATCLCVRYQAKTTKKHLKEVKGIVCYLQGTINMGLWYLKDSGFELTGFSDADYARCKDTFKSTSAIAISCNPVQHSRTKHIDVRYHFIKEHVEKGTIELYFVKTDYQLADIFTKALPAYRFNNLVHRLGSVDGVTTSFQLSQNSRPPCPIIKDKYMMKAQVHVSKSFTISDVQALPQRKHYCQNVKVYVEEEIVSKLSRS